MKLDIGRWILILIIGAIFVGMYFSIDYVGYVNAKKSEVNVSEDVTINVTNTSIVVEVSDSEVTVTGKGMLTCQDLEGWLSANGVEKAAIEKMSIEGDIDTIDYHTVYDYPNLKTLIIGNSVSSVRSSAIKECPSLKEVYLSSAVKSVPYDFIYGASDCKIFTDAADISFLIESNLGDGNIVCQVESMDGTR